MDFEGVAEFVGNYRVCDTGFECACLLSVQLIFV